MGNGIIEPEQERLSKIIKLNSKIELIKEENAELRDLKPFKSNIKEKLIDNYRELLIKTKDIILKYKFLKDLTSNSYIDEIREYKLFQINVLDNYLELNENLYGIENVDFTFYLRLNNYIFNFISNERNLVAHQQISKSPEEFYKEIYPSKINQMLSNFDKAIENISITIKGFENNDDYSNLTIYYEILGDLYIQKLALLKYYSRNKMIEYIQEAIKAVKNYNITFSYRKRIGGSMLYPRVPDYMPIFEDFFFFEENEGQLLNLDYKLKYIEKRLNIWKKSLPDIKFATSPIRGFKDFYPADLREYKYIYAVIEDIADLYGYEEYEGPLLEPIEIFAAKSSQELINKQSFIVEKIKDKRLILRPEMTPTLARMIAKKAKELKKPIRWYVIPTCYRYEEPQKGRMREFKQINFDILGEDKLYADLEIFNIIVDIFRSFGARANQFQIYYNNRRFIDAVCKLLMNVPDEKIQLVYKLLDKSNKMDEDEFEKFVYDSFQDKIIVQGIFKLKGSVNFKDLLNKFTDVPKEFYESVGYKELIYFENLINEAEISDFCTFSSSVVRGLDYYTGIVYEVFDTGSENTRSIFGGGRYDDLLSIFSDEKISGTGFGMGVLMLSLFLKTYKLLPEEIKENDNTNTIYIASINETVSGYALELARIIRDGAFPCIVDYSFKNLKKQLSRASDLGVSISIIVGPNEMKQKRTTIKNMVSEEQQTVDLEQLIEKIFNILDEIEDPT